MSLKNRFLSIYPKISTFRKKGRFFEITLKKSFFCACIRKDQNSTRRLFSLDLFKTNSFLTKNMNIWRKITLFWNLFEKLVILPIYPKKEFSPSKNRFLSISVKISRFREKLRFFEITLKKSFFVDISENTNISRKSRFFWDHIEKIVSWPCLPKYQISSKRLFFRCF